MQGTWAARLETASAGTASDQTRPHQGTSIRRRRPCRRTSGRHGRPSGGSCRRRAARRASRGQPGVGIAAEHGDQVGPRGQQRGVDARVPGDLADPRRHQRDGRALATGRARRRRRARPAARRPCRRRRRRAMLPPIRPAAVALVDAAGLAQLLERRSAGAGRCRGWRGRAAPGGPACRWPPPPAPATPPRAWATARAFERSDRASFSLSQATSGSSPRSAGCAAPRTPPRPTPSRPSVVSSATSRSCSSSSDATSAAAYACWASVSGRRSQSVRRSPLAGVMPSSPCSSDDQRRRAVADEPGRDLGVEQVAPGSRPTAWVSTSRSCWAAWATASAGLLEQPAQRAPGRRPAGRRARVPAAASASCTSARRGKYVRSRWNSVSMAYRGSADQLVDDLVELGGRGRSSGGSRGLVSRGRRRGPDAIHAAVPPATLTTSTP